MSVGFWGIFRFLLWCLFLPYIFWNQIHTICIWLILISFICIILPYLCHAGGWYLNWIECFTCSFGFYWTEYSSVEKESTNISVLYQDLLMLRSVLFLKKKGLKRALFHTSFSNVLEVIRSLNLITNSFVFIDCSFELEDSKWNLYCVGGESSCLSQQWHS